MTKKLFILFLSLLCSCEVYSQCPCVNVIDTIGCTPHPVTATDCSSGGTALRYQFEVSLGYGISNTHTYSLAGQYEVIQRGNFTCGGTSGTKFSTPKRVVVKPIPAPQLSTSECPDRKALIIVSDPQYDEYVVDDGAGNMATIARGQSVVFTFTDTLTKVLNVRGNYLGTNCGGTGTLTINSYSTLHRPVVTELNVLSATQANLKFQAITYQRYEIQKRIGITGVYVPVDTLDGVQGLQTVLFGNLNTTTTSYCFRVRTFDYCGLREVFSPEYCTTVLSGSAQNQANQLQWTDNVALSSGSYQLKVNGQNVVGFASRPSARAFEDTSVVCGQEYCYQLVANYPSGTQTLSNQLCVDAISNAIPPVIQEMASSVVGNAIELSWPVASAQSYLLYFSSNKTSYSPLASTTAVSYVDNGHNPSLGQYCYKVSYIDNCGNASPISTPTCPVFLTGQVNDAASRRLSWEALIGWSEGVAGYVVEKLDESGNPYFSQAVGTVVEFLDKGLDTLEQVIYYRIKVISSTGRISYSNVWEAQQKGGFFMPNAFTPNGDGLNDAFHAEGLFIKEFKMEIWDQNGQAVFASTSFRQGWDGKLNGQPMPLGTYFYKVEATDKLGVRYKRNGTLQLIK